MENLSNAEQIKRDKITKHVKAISGFYRHLTVYVLINLFLIGAQYFNLDDNETFWEFSTFSTAFWWGLGVAFHAVGVFGSGLFLGRNWEERKIQELIKKEKQQRWE